MNGGPPSFLIESLVYNAPDACFDRAEGSYYEDVQAVIARLRNDTQGDAACAEFKEVNAIKSLFGPDQAWSRQQAHDFLLASWRHVGFPSN